MTGNILLIEDDQKLAEMIRDYLGDSGFKVTIAGNGTDGFSFLEKQSFDALILDLMLPDMNGLDICKTLQGGDHNTPILMLTAKGDPMDRVIGLELGADDYMPKPFEPRELLARIRAILRRGKNIMRDHIKRFGRLEIDTSSMTASIDGKQCVLTAYQFQLLEIMSRSSGRVLTRDFLMNELQGNDMEAFDRSIDVHVSRIRSEIEDDPKHPRRIITVRGTGYVFARAQEDL